MHRPVAVQREPFQNKSLKMAEEEGQNALSVITIGSV